MPSIVPNRLPEKGSFLRPAEGGGFRSQVAAPFPTATELAAGASSTLTLSIQEIAALDRLVISAWDTTSNADMTHVVAVTGIAIGTDVLLASTASGTGVPAPMFVKDAVSPVRFGHRVSKLEDVTLTIKNCGSGTVKVNAGFATL